MAIPKKLLDAAMVGDAQAQLEVGRLYAGGGADYYDLEEAFLWFEKAADRDLPDAVLEVALAKEYGLGVDRDHEVAFAAYVRAARLYHGPLPFTIRGLVLTQDLCLARHRGQLSLAEAGYAHSQWSYVYGPKRKGNPAREVNPKKWLKRQAEAKKWTRSAAMLGYPPAFIDMSCLINRGEGEPGDVENLHGWYLKALEHDKSIAKLICKGSEPMTADWFSGRADPAVTGIVPRAESIKAWNRVWSESRQDRNGTSLDGMSAEAAKNLGDLHYRGKSGSEPDYVEASKWYLCAAGRGCQWSMGQLAKMYLNGLGVARDAAKGFDWLDRQFAVVFCNGTRIVDQRILFHWAVRPIVEGHLDHLDEEQLFAWLQARTHAFEPACAALSGGYDFSESSAAANQVCKAFRPHVFVKGKLDEATRKVVSVRVKRITRLLARQEAAMIARAEAGDAPSQFWYAAFFKRYKNRSGMALRWLLKSAEQGYSPAQHEVAKAYADGDGAPISVGEARRWFKAASLSGDTWAQGSFIQVLAGTYYWGDYPKTPERAPSKEDLFEAYAWSIATEERTNESDAWLKYSPEQVLAAYRRADEIRREIA
jgi:TPR repeat protein